MGLLACSLVVIVGLSSSAWAQSPTASLSGTVQDSQSSVIAGAKVTITGLRTGAKQEVQTEPTGLYAFRQLDIGEYILEAEMQGFRKYIRKGIVLTTGDNIEMNISMELGAVTESITVSEAASRLETRTSDYSQLVEAKSVENLPLGDRRSLNLIQMTGAAVFVNYEAGGKPNFSLAGGRTQSQNFWIDGGTGQNMRLGVGQVDMDPPVETLQEVKVLSNSVSAEYGGSNGGNIIATTKSGTNQFHGSLFEYLRNDKLDAPGFFAPVVDGEKRRPMLRYNVFGGTIGGPVRKNGTFFFFGYEGSRRRTGAIRTLTVPSALMRQGDFSETFNAAGRVIPIYDPSTTIGTGNTATRQLFPGNRIPASRFDPVAVKIVDFYPVPNRAPDAITGVNNWRANQAQGLTRNNFTAKIDHNFGEKNRVTGRYLYNSDDVVHLSAFAQPAADTVNSTIRHQQYWYGNYTRVFSPTWLNDLRFTYSNRVNHAQSQGLGEAWATQLGLRGIPDGAFPRFAPAGVTAIGTNAQERRQFPIEQWQVVNNMTVVKGRHTMKFGFEIRPSFNYEINRPTAAGDFAFGIAGTGLPGNNTVGVGFATMLLGFGTGFSARETELLDRYSYYLAGFVQDDWTLTRDLTLNLGMRWETDTPITDRNNRFNSFDMTQINPVSGTPGVVKFGGVNGWRTSVYDTDWNNLAPRIGLAWKPFGSTRMVVRSAYGVFYAHPFDAGAPTSASLGFEKSANLNSPDAGLTPALLLRNGVQVSLTAPPLNDSFGAVRVGQATTNAPTFYETNRRTGYSQQWNLTIQREFGNGWLTEVGYLGNISHKLASSNLGINQIRPERVTPQSTQRDRPFPQFTNVTLVLPSLGDAAYHAGTAKLERRFSGGFNVLTTYTWAKNMNNTNEGGGGAVGETDNVYMDYYNRRLDWGPSGNDIRHRWTWSGVYEMPFGKGRKWLTNHPLRHLVGDWSLGGLMMWQSAPPFSVATQVNNTFAFSTGGQRADVLRNPNLPSNQRTVTRWFDTDAFAQPAPTRFGNSGPGIVRGDTIFNLDLSVLRDFRIREGLRLQFRGEFLNAPNHTNFQEAGGTFGGPGFGVVSAQSTDARSIQLGLRMVF
ncbi:MAG: TonB-dependent receptor [Bryobacterales bacterium]|nr:TonB-dependent receptor [Bryobacterales bacterium]